jgi:hypothetical protein
LAPFPAALLMALTNATRRSCASVRLSVNGTVIVGDGIPVGPLLALLPILFPPIRKLTV